MEDFIERLDKEYEELENKVIKLEAFLMDDKKMQQLERIHQDLLWIQASAMKTYKNVLRVRIDKLKLDAKTKN